MLEQRSTVSVEGRNMVQVFMNLIILKMNKLSVNGSNLPFSVPFINQSRGTSKSKQIHIRIRSQQRKYEQDRHTVH